LPTRETATAKKNETRRRANKTTPLLLVLPFGSTIPVKKSL